MREPLKGGTLKIPMNLSPEVGRTPRLQPGRRQSTACDHLHAAPFRQVPRR